MTSGIPITAADVPTALKCVKVYIPDGDVHLYALRGQLSNVGKSWFWDTGGDVDLAREVAGWWIAASEATDLTLGCDDMAECNVNVNVNCGCGDGLPTTILCYDQNGQPIVTNQPPVSPTVPTSPVSDTWPVNPLTDTVPDGFEDWTQFDTEACGVANALWQLVYGWVVVAEGGIDTLATMGAAIALLFPSTAAEILAIIGGPYIIKWGEGLLEVILSEQASDILNEAREWLETNKQEIVCLIFQYRYDIPTMQIAIVRSFYNYISSVLTLTPEEETAVRNWGKSLFPVSLLLTWFFEFDRYIAAQEPINCAACAGNQGITWVAGEDHTEGDPTFALVHEGPTYVKASGTLTRNGAGDYRWGWVSLQAALSTVYTGPVHGIEFVVNELSSPAGDMNWTVRGINIGKPTTGQSVIVHDGTLDGTGYGVVATGAPSTWGPANVPNEISSGIIATTANATGQPTGTYTIDVQQVYFLDDTGARIE